MAERPTEHRAAHERLSTGGLARWYRACATHPRPRRGRDESPGLGHRYLVEYSGRMRTLRSFVFAVIASSFLGGEGHSRK